MKKLTKRIYSILAFTGLWLVPFVYIIISQAFPTVETKTLVIISLILVAWTSFNNFWTIACEGKQLDEIGIGDGLMIDTGLKKNRHRSGLLCIQKYRRNCYQRSQRELF